MLVSKLKFMSAGFLIASVLSFNTAAASEMSSTSVQALEAQQEIYVKKSEASIHLGDKVAVYQNECFISSARHGTQYRCIKTKLTEGTVVREMTNGDFVVKTQAPAAATASKGYSVEKLNS